MNWYDISLTMLLLLLVNGLTGCVLYGVWRLLLKAFSRRMDIQVSYILLRLIVLLFLVPGVGVIRVCEWIGNGYLSSVVEVLSMRELKIISGFAMIWSVGAVGLLISAGWKRRRGVRLIASGSMPCQIGWMSSAKMIGNRLEMKRKVTIREVYHGEHFFVTGIWHPTIYVPEGQYPEEDRNVVLLHEMTHIRVFDLLWKGSVDAVRCLYWPLVPVWFMVKDVDVWSEFHCDYLSCNVLGSARDYFLLIERLITDGSRWSNSSWVAFMGQTKEELILRMSVMRNQQKLSRVRTVWVFCAAIAFLMAGSTTALAGTYSTVREYRQIYWESLQSSLVFENCEPVQQEEQVLDRNWRSSLKQRIRQDAPWLEDPADPGMVPEVRSAFFEWNLSAGEIFLSEPIPVKSEQEIILGCGPEPAGDAIPVGFVYPDGSLHYVRLADDGMQIFQPGTDGELRLFVGNVSHEKKNMGGYWMIRKIEG